MKTSFENDNELRDLMKQGTHSMPHFDLEDKIMKKVEYVAQHNQVVRKNLRVSWGLLALSVLLFPASFWYAYTRADLTLIPRIGDSLNNFAEVLLPGGILICSIVILLQIDNLLKLSLRKGTGF